MRFLYILFFTLVLSFSSFAAITPVLGTASVCVGSTTPLSDATLGGTWSSSAAGVATVGSNTGIVAGVAAGTSTITYTVGSAYVTQVVTVNALPGPITGLNTICIGDSIELADATPGGTWSSAGTAIATVDGSGEVTGVSANTVNITYTAGDGCATFYPVTVKPLPLPISGASALCLDSAEYFSDATVGGTWSSSDPAVLSINSITGYATGVAAGTAIITYRSGVSCITATEVYVGVPLSSAATVAPICDSTIFHYVPSSVVSGATFAWSRPYVAGIASLAASGTDTISDLLVNVTTIPIAVTYVYTLSAGGCSNIVDITVTVNPRPVLSSTPTPPQICDSTTFAYTPTGVIPGTTFAWSLPAIPGIANPPASGTGAIEETLVNHSALPIGVTYLYTLTVYGCSVTDTVTDTVNPKPVLSSTLTPPAICDTQIFNYTPASLTPGVIFEWIRPAETGISDTARYGYGDPNELLVDTTLGAVVVTYQYTLKINGCINEQNVVVTVDQCDTSLLVNNVYAPVATYTIFPNPATNQLTIQSTHQPINQITVTNLLGQIIYTQSVTTNSRQFTINCTAFPSGIYFVKVSFGSGQDGDTEVRKFVKE